MLSLLLLRVAEIRRSLKLQLLYLGLMQLIEGLLEITLLPGLALKARISRRAVLRVVSDMVGGSTSSSCFLCHIASCFFYILLCFAVMAVAWSCRFRGPVSFLLCCFAYFNLDLI